MAFQLRLTAWLCLALRAVARSQRGVVMVLILGHACAAENSRVPARSVERSHSADGFQYFRFEIPRTIRADHPAIVPVATAIRAISRDPLEQIVMVNDVTHLLVDYDDDARVYGRVEFQATLDEMIARRRAAGWVYLRDDCDGRAVFAAHLLATLGISWRLKASYWTQHAWVVARVNGTDYDLLNQATEQPDSRRLGFRLIGRHVVPDPNPPPYFRWREAWAQATDHNVEIGKRLGLLELDSTPAAWRQRNSVDWTKRHPAGLMSPFDPHMLSAAYAAFPLGEALRVGMTAQASTTGAAIAAASAGVR